MLYRLLGSHAVCPGRHGQGHVLFHRKPRHERRFLKDYSHPGIRRGEVNLTARATHQLQHLLVTTC